ncbi:hypothetical protein [Streptomyces sp. NPDC047985]|uniref:hypothetical protein n=1 Tax=unclassified Streptomyces TaxID=2593676 RepID=UPI003448489B
MGRVGDGERAAVETASTHSVTSDRVGYGMLTLVGLALVILMPLLVFMLGPEGLRARRNRRNAAASAPLNSRRPVPWCAPRRGSSAHHSRGRPGNGA